MSTILKALRRLEQESESPQQRALRERVLSAPVPGEPERRRTARRAVWIGACALVLAALAFVAGRELAPHESAAPAVAAGPAAAALQTAPVASAPSPWSTPGSVLPASSAHELDSEPALDPGSASFAVVDPGAPGLTPDDPLAADVRALAERDRALADEPGIDVPSPAPAAPALRRDEVLAQPSPRRDLDAPEPASAESLHRQSFDDEAAHGANATPGAQIDSVPIARATTPPAPGAIARSATTPRPARPSARAGAATKAPPMLRVTRTVWHPDAARRLALVRTSKSSAAREVREGDVIDGFEIRRIEPSGLVLERDGVETRRRVGEGS